MCLIETKAGYLDVKIPAKSRGLRILKAWRKRWVVVSSKDLQPPSLIVQVYASDSFLHKDRSCLFQRIITADNASVYRSRSRTHKHSFSIAEDCNPALHLAGTTETESQEWMACMRDLLWPPNPVEQVNTVLNGRYEVSLIDNEFSCQSGMLGSYGYLSVTRNKLSLTAPQTGYVIKEWKLKHIKRYQLVPQACKEDSHKIFSFLTISDAPGLIGQLQFFSVDSVSIIDTMSEAFDQYRHNFESLLDSPIREDHNLIQFDDDVFHRNEATTDDELDVRISLGSSGSTGTSSSGGSLPLRLFSLPDNMLDCSITSSQMAQECESQSYSHRSSHCFNYDHLAYDFSAEFESLADDNKRMSYSSVTSHVYADILDTASRRQSESESVYEEIEEHYENDQEKEYHPPLPPRNFLPVHKESSLKECDDVSSNLQSENSTVLKRIFGKKTKHDTLDNIANITKTSIYRTKSTPVFYVSLAKSQQTAPFLSRSAPSEPLCFTLPAEYIIAEDNITVSSNPSENQLLSQSLKLRQRSKTCPGSNNDLELLLTELSNSEPKHRKFKQCLKTLSDGNLLASDFPLSTASCAELFSEFKRFSSDYCKMNSMVVDTSGNQNDPDYMDMNGANADTAIVTIAQV